MRNLKWAKRVLPMILAAVFMFSAFPASAAQQDEAILVPAIASEVVSLREESAKQFLCEDGTFLVGVYGSPVHYWENGEWKDIDNSLILSSRALSASGKATYTPKASAQSISIPQDFTNGQQISVSSKGYTFAFGASTANRSVALHSVAAIVDVESAPSVVVEQQGRVDEFSLKMQSEPSKKELTRQMNAEKMAVDNLSSAVVYKGMFPGSDLEYIVTPDRIKENIIVSTPQREYIYRFDVSMDGLAAVPQEDGSILLIEESAPENVIFILEAPYMYDANGETSYDVSMILKDDVLIVTANAEWLNDEARAWPVVIDPTLNSRVSTDGISILDTYVTTLFNDSGYINSNKIYAGRTILGERTRTYVKFSLPTSIPAGSLLSNAEFEVTKASTSANNILNVYNLSTVADWNNNITWNNQPVDKAANAASSLPLVSSTNTVSGTSIYRFDITSVLKSWFAKSIDNHGLIIVTPNESSSGQVDLHSSRASTPSNRPALKFEYTAPTLSPTSWAPGPAVATSSAFTVTSTAGWTLTDNQTWITTSKTSGTGNSTFTISVIANAASTARSGTVTVRSSSDNAIIGTIAVTQAGELLTVNSTSWAPPHQGGASSAVSITSNTNWTTTSNQSWLTVSRASGSNNNTFTMNATANTTASARTATVTVKSASGAITRTIAVTQAKQNIAVNPTSWEPPRQGGTSSALSITSDTSWTITDDQDWITTSKTSGTGNSTFTITATANTGTSQRTGTVTIQSTTNNAILATVTVKQAGAISVSPANWAADPLGGTSSAFNIAFDAGWTITDDQAWITTSKTSGTGSSTFTITATANTGTSQRTGTVTVSSTSDSTTFATVSVTQAAPSLSINSTSWETGTSGGTSPAISITSNTSWTITPKVSWLTVSKASGSSNSSFTITAASYIGDAPRVGTVDVKAGSITRTVTVTQTGIIAVTNASQLRAALSGGALGRIIKLQNNIPADGNWVPININGGNFILDGNGKTLTFNSVNRTPQGSEVEAGLFGRVTGSSTNIIIKNLGVIGRVDATPIIDSGTGPSQIRAGGLVALVNGGSFTVENTYFMNVNEGVQAVRDRWNSSATSNAGGFFGEIASSAVVSISNCFVNADVKSDTRAKGSGNNATSYAGGFVGRVTGAASLTIERSYAAGTVSANALSTKTTANRYAGGLIGRTESSITPSVSNSSKCNKIIWLNSEVKNVNEPDYGTARTLTQMKTTSLTTLFGSNASNTWERKSKPDPSDPTKTIVQFPSLKNVSKSGVLDDTLTLLAGANSSAYYKDIALMSMHLAGFDVYYDDVIENKMLNKAEFDDFKSYDYSAGFWNDLTSHIASHAIAHKTISGKTIVTISIRGTGLEHDGTDSAGKMISNFVTTSMCPTNHCSSAHHGLHHGFRVSADRVMGNLLNYLSENGLNNPSDSNLRFVVTGHSRGGSVGNLLAARLNDEYNTKGRLFNYNFAVPNTINRTIKSINQNNYTNILNICNTKDFFVGYPFNIPGRAWEKYGVTAPLEFTVDGDTDERLGAHRAEVYQRYIRGEGMGGHASQVQPLGISPEPNMYELFGTQLLGSDTIGAILEESPFTMEQIITIYTIFDAQVYGYPTKEAGLIHFFTNVAANPNLLNSFSRVYNSDDYASQNPDIAQALDDDPIAMLQHYLETGMDLGLSAIAGWNVHTYKANYIDLQEVFGDNLAAYTIHYAAQGFSEGRTG